MYKIEVTDDYINIGEKICITFDEAETMEGTQYKNSCFRTEYNGWDILDHALFLANDEESKYEAINSLLISQSIDPSIIKKNLKKNIRYFNFPIQLLEGFLKNSDIVLANIRDYAFYNRMEVKEDGGCIEYKDLEGYFNVALESLEESYSNGEKLSKLIPENSPMTGLNTKVFLDYYKKPKSEFENVCLLSHLALKSILLNKRYCKVTKDFWLSRMDGKPGKTREFSNEIKLHNNEYRMNKIKKALRDEWGLIYYARFSRGIYVSYKLSIDELVYEVEKKRKSKKEKDANILQKAAIEKAYLKLK